MKINAIVLEEFPDKENNCNIRKVGEVIKDMESKRFYELESKGLVEVYREPKKDNKKDVEKED